MTEDHSKEKVTGPASAGFTLGLSVTSEGHGALRSPDIWGPRRHRRPELVAGAVPSPFPEEWRRTDGADSRTVGESDGDDSARGWSRALSFFRSRVHDFAPASSGMASHTWVWCPLAAFSPRS